MKNLMLGVAILAAYAISASAARAADLETLDPQIASSFAQVLTEAAAKIEKPQVKIDADCEKSCGVHEEQHGLILVPNKEIGPENEAVNSDPGAPLAHLFMSKGYTLVIDGKPIDKAKLRTINLTGPDGNEQHVMYLALAARHNDDDSWHLYCYGCEDKPLVDARIGEGAGPGTQPLALEVKDVENNIGTAYITIHDRYQCSFKIAYKPE